MATVEITQMAAITMQNAIIQLQDATNDHFPAVMGITGAGGVGRTTL
jgi:putative protein kinase ArgK-like GTPase of G3E family